MPLVFFYGTLLRNGANHWMLRELGAAFRSEARTRDPHTLVDLGPYPALVSREAATKNAMAGSHIFGEVWEVNSEALIDLDAFEGCPDLYSREEIAVHPLDARSDAKELVAFTYVLTGSPPEGVRVLTSGRYEGRGVPLPNGARRPFDSAKTTKT